VTFAGERFSGEDSAKALSRALEKYQEVLGIEGENSEALGGWFGKKQCHPFLWRISNHRISAAAGAAGGGFFFFFFFLYSGQVMWVSATKELDSLRKTQLLNQSIEFFQRAVAIEQGDGRLHFNLGQSLGELAEICQDGDQIPQAQALLDRGLFPFRYFLDWLYSPSWMVVAMAEVLRAADLHQTELQGSELAEEDREEVREDLVDALLSLATLSANLASLVTEVAQSSALFTSASQVIERALGAGGDKARPEILIKSGQIFVQMAEQEQRLTGVVNTQTFEAAFARFSEALTSEYVSPVEGLCERGDALHTFATTMFDLAASGGVTSPGDLAQIQLIGVTRLEQAQKDYETAVQLEPETPSIFSKLGDTMLLLWKSLPQERRDPTLPQRAIEAYTRSMNVPFKRNEDPDTLYGLAAVYTLLGNVEESRRWLLRWKAKGGVGAMVLRDGDFASLHSQDWFKSEFA